MNHQVAILNNLHLLPETEKQIQTLTSTSISFPNDADSSTTKDFIKRTGSADIVLISPGGIITSEYLNACPWVKYVAICGTSTANANLDELQRRGIKWSNIVDYGDEPTAEFVFMQLLSLTRGVGKYQWREYPHELMGKRIGIIGLGSLGKAISHLALAYKMNVTYHSKHRKSDWEERGLKYLELNDLLQTSEIIVISSPTNVIVIDEDEFSLICPGSILVQVSAGEVIDRKAFLNWIAVDRNFAMFDYAAGKNVYDAYSNLPRVIFSKIPAGHSYETKKRLGQGVIENLKTFLNSYQGFNI